MTPPLSIPLGGKAKLVHPVDMRSHLARVTQGLHQALHTHPLFDFDCHMLTGSVRNQQIHQAFWMFYTGVDIAISECTELSRYRLDEEIAQFQNDFDTSDWVAGTVAPGARAYGLGLLYVAHGTAFGKSTLLKSVEQGLSVSPSGFLTSKPNSKRWRFLLQELDTLSGDACTQAEAVLGATAAFNFFSVCAKLALRSV